MRQYQEQIRLTRRSAAIMMLMRRGCPQSPESLGVIPSIEAIATTLDNIRTGLTNFDGQYIAPPGCELHIYNVKRSSGTYSYYKLTAENAMFAPSEKEQEVRVIHLSHQHDARYIVKIKHSQKGKCYKYYYQGQYQYQTKKAYNMKPINVVIIENENISRIGAATILSETGAIQVCGVAKYGKQGIEIVDKEKPDIVIINIDLPDIDGIDVISTIKSKHASIRIVVMTANSSRDTINAAISNGADCYYAKNSVREEVGERFVEAVMAAYNNESWIDPTINRILIDSLRSNDTPDRNALDLLSDFSNKEITVLQLAAGGMKNNEIANVMYVSEGTVRSYLHNSFIKLGVKDRLNAIREAIRLGILSFTDMKIEEEVTQETHTRVKTNQKSQKDTAKTSNKGYKGWVA